MDLRQIVIIQMMKASRKLCNLQLQTYKQPILTLFFNLSLKNTGIFIGDRIVIADFRGKTTKKQRNGAINLENSPWNLFGDYVNLSYLRKVNWGDIGYCSLQ